MYRSFSSPFFAVTNKSITLQRPWFDDYPSSGLPGIRDAFVKLAAAGKLGKPMV
jgi:hypothetical protein